MTRKIVRVQLTFFQIALFSKWHIFASEIFPQVTFFRVRYISEWHFLNWQFFASTISFKMSDSCGFISDIYQSFVSIEWQNEAFFLKCEPPSQILVTINSGWTGGQITALRWHRWKLTKITTLQMSRRNRNIQVHAHVAVAELRDCSQCVVEN